MTSNAALPQRTAESPGRLLARNRHPGHPVSSRSGPASPATAVTPTANLSPARKATDRASEARPLPRVQLPSELSTTC